MVRSARLVYKTASSIRELKASLNKINSISRSLLWLFSLLKDFFFSHQKIFAKPYVKYAAAIVPSVVYNDLAFRFFRPFVKMICFCSTNNFSKKKWKNTNPIFYKNPPISTTISCEDNFSYLLIITVDLSILSAAGSDILFQGLRKHAVSLQILST